MNEIRTAVDNNGIELCEDGELQYSYAQLAYDPPSDVGGRRRSVELLRAIVRILGDATWLEKFVGSTRREFGLNRTVWGVKAKGDAAAPEFSMEFYYYAHSDDTPLTLRRVQNVIASVDLSAAALDLDQELWSISVDIPMNESAMTVADFHVYAVHDSDPPTCASYRAGARLELENVYYLYRGAASSQMSKHWLKQSLHCADIDRVLFDRLFPCDHVAVAHKPSGDGIYYGGLTAEQLVGFLDECNFPAEVREAVRDVSGDFQHLLWDAGLDVERVSSSGSSVSKRAFMALSSDTSDPGSLNNAVSVGIRELFQRQSLDGVTLWMLREIIASSGRSEWLDELAEHSACLPVDDYLAMALDVGRTRPPRPRPAEELLAGWSAVWWSDDVWSDPDAVRFLESRVIGPMASTVLLANHVAGRTCRPVGDRPPTGHGRRSFDAAVVWAREQATPHVGADIELGLGLVAVLRWVGHPIEDSEWVTLALASLEGGRAGGDSAAFTAQFLVRALLLVEGVRRDIDRARR